MSHGNLPRVRQSSPTREPAELLLPHLQAPGVATLSRS
jgi:hypothetical protein